MRKIIVGFAILAALIAISQLVTLGAENAGNQQTYPVVITAEPTAAPTATPALEPTPSPTPEMTTAPTAAPVSRETDYVLNTNTMKFHDPTCASIGDIKDKNRENYTGTRDALIDMGYAPCGRCHP